MRPHTVVILVVLFLLSSGSQASVSMGIYQDPDHYFHCVVDGIIMWRGRSITHPRRCEELLCSFNSAVMRRTCPPGQIKFGKIKAPKAKYPACCLE